MQGIGGSWLVVGERQEVRSAEASDGRPRTKNQGPMTKSRIFLKFAGSNSGAIFAARDTLGKAGRNTEVAEDAEKATEPRVTPEIPESCGCEFRATIAARDTLGRLGKRRAMDAER